MTREDFKRQFAECTAAAFRHVYPDVYGDRGDVEVFNADFVHEHLEKPKDPKMGRFTFPVFKYAGLLGQKPSDIASNVAPATMDLLRQAGHTRVGSEAASGFLNAKVDSVALAEGTLKSILSAGAEYGSADRGRRQKFLIEYSSPNIAKPFGIAHLRTTIIGNSLRRIYRKLGFDVIGINYLGDWGTQFGKMIVAFARWGNPSMLEENAVENLHALYVRFHKEAETDASLDDAAREAFRRLEEGDEEARRLWKDFAERSMREFRRVYDRMGIEFDEWMGESHMNAEMEKVIERLQRDGLTSISDGALVVDLKDPQLPPCLLRKADGATLYATRDIAGMVYRWEKYRFYESLYVVASAQSDHFRQVYKTVAMMEEAEQLPAAERMTGRVKHIDFGWVKFGEQTMSSRRGNVIYLDDVVEQASDRVKKIIAEKNPELEGIDRIAEMVGVGAVVFSQFSVRRLKDVNFDWDAVLNFDGETGPYLQYTHARLCSLLRNYGGEIGGEPDWKLLGGEEETRVVELLDDFPEAIEHAAKNYDPFFISWHLLRLAGAFNTLYQRKDQHGRIDKIISDNAELTAARIALVKAVRIVLKEGLNLLGIKAPEAM